MAQLAKAFNLSTPSLKYKQVCLPAVMLSEACRASDTARIKRAKKSNDKDYDCEQLGVANQRTCLCPHHKTIISTNSVHDPGRKSAL